MSQTRNATFVVLIAVYILASRASVASGDVYVHHPEFAPRLGETFDSADPLSIKTHGFLQLVPGPGIDIHKKCRSEGRDSLPFSLSMQLQSVRNTSELEQAMRFEGQVEASYGLSKGRVSAAHSSQVQIDDRSVVFVLQVEKVYAPDRADVELTERGMRFLRKAVEAKDYSAFLQVIGTDVVTSVTRGSSLSIVYNFRCSSKTKADSLRVELAAKWKTGSVSGSVATFARKIDEFVSLDVNAYQVGSKPDEDLLQLISATEGNLAQVKKIAQKAAQRVPYESCPVLVCKTTKIGDLPEIRIGNSPEAVRGFLNAQATRVAVARQVSRWWRGFVRVEADLELAERLEAYPPRYFRNGALKDLKSEVKRLRGLRERILKAYADAVAWSEGKGDGVSPNQGRPFRLKNYLELPFLRVAGWGRWMSDWGEMRTARCYRSHFWPVVKLVHPSLIKTIWIYRDKALVGRIDGPGIRKIEAHVGALSSYDRAQVVWESVVDSVCHTTDSDHRERLIREYMAVHRSREGSVEYKVVVEDITGGEHETELGNIVNWRDAAKSDQATPGDLTPKKD